MPLTYRKAKMLITMHGGLFLRNGSNHDIFLLPDGQEFQLPRHGKDLKPGLEAALRKRLGIKKS